jgi:nitric oxide reductase NorE protein
MVTTARPAAQARAIHLPGEPGVWVFIGGDMVVFALFFVTFVWYRADDVPLYAAGQATLDQLYGALNTFLLLTSSWCVALAVDSARAGRADAARRSFGAAFACGAGFVAIKYFEYGEKIAAGFGLNTNDFYMFYFMLTGIHLLHVAIGMGVLAFMWHSSRARPLDGVQVRTLECGASFWHMVDILWIVLFALLYLMR